VIFLGLINVEGDPYVIEYNCRFGDPETEVVLPRLANDLLELFNAVADRNLDQHTVSEDPRTVATVMMCANGYPENYEKGHPIVIPAPTKHTVVFHAGTMTGAEGDLQSNGGRVLAVSSWGDNKNEAIDRSYAFISKISFPDGFYRKDIGFDL